MKGKIVSVFSVIAVLVIAVLGNLVNDGRSFALAIFLSAILCCLPFFAVFENKVTTKNTTRYLTLVAVMTAVSVAGRFLFAPVPFFKPVSAVVIVTALCLGSHAGFVTGAMSALVSNFYFGQGPWTPFQMLAWGLVGFFAGLLSKPLEKSRILLSLYGAFAGLFYSVLMDSWSVIFMDGNLNLKRFSAFFVTSLPVTVCYVVSNVVFLLVIGKPVADSLNRVIKKYGILKKE